VSVIPPSASAPRPSVAVPLTEHTPTVSIGLPVFNGARYLGQTIASILGQSFADLELIISDNASTDATQSICEAYAQADARVRYFRNARNLGAGPNYDNCFAKARGRYFKWAAHDDLLAPDFIARAVAALETNPKAVLCTVGITEIGADNEVLRRYVNPWQGAQSGSTAQRFGCLIHTRHQCEDFFGLYRREALIRSGLHGMYAGSDRVLLAEMALRGPFVTVDAPLFLHREHDQRYTRAVLLGDRKAAAAWQDATAKSARKPELFHWGVYCWYWRTVRRNSLPPADRWACYAQLLRWWFTDGHAADMLRDVLRRYSPWAMRLARTIKHRLFGTKDRLPPGSLPDLS
jgi:glycosyltransferase involved in cell wall biosynthesis